MVNASRSTITVMVLLNVVTDPMKWLVVKRDKIIWFQIFVIFVIRFVFETLHFHNAKIFLVVHGFKFEGFLRGSDYLYCCSKRLTMTVAKMLKATLVNWLMPTISG